MTRFIGVLCCALALSFAGVSLGHPAHAADEGGEKGGFWSKLRAVFTRQETVEAPSVTLDKQTPYLKGADLATVQAALTRPETSRRDVPFAATHKPIPKLRWDGVKGSEAWTKAIMAGLATEGAILSATVPRDIEAWCPAYRDAPRAQRDLFWAGLLSTLAKHESTYRPKAVGGGGKWYGLVQILPATARGYGCRAQSREALKDGALNMRCAIRIMAVTVPRDQVVAENWRGVAADWGPFHSKRKRHDMRDWVKAQPYCKVG